MSVPKVAFSFTQTSTESHFRNTRTVECSRELGPDVGDERPQSGFPLVIKPRHGLPELVLTPPLVGQDSLQILDLGKQ